jgi:dihydroneopterin aldolase
MAGPEHLAARLQRFAIERLRLHVAALVLVQKGQVVEAGQRVRVAGPEHLASPLQRFALDLSLEAHERSAGLTAAVTGSIEYRGHQCALSLRIEADQR